MGLEVSELIANYWLKKNMETETACHTFGPYFLLLKRKIHPFYQIRVDFPAARVNCSPRDSLILFKQFKKVLIESQPPTLANCSIPFFVFSFFTSRDSENAENTSTSWCFIWTESKEIARCDYFWSKKRRNESTARICRNKHESKLRYQHL